MFFLVTIIFLSSLSRIRISISILQRYLLGTVLSLFQGTKEFISSETNEAALVNFGTHYSSSRSSSRRVSSTLLALHVKLAATILHE